MLMVFDHKSQLRQALEELKKSREQRELVQMVAKMGTFEWNAQTNKISWTPELETLYGLKPGGFTGHYRDWLNFLHPEDQEQACQACIQAINTKKELNTEFRILWPNQSIHWILAKGRIFYNKHQKLIRMIGINMDITEHKQIEEERSRLAHLAQSSNDAIYGLNLKGVILCWNKGAEKIFGYQPQEIIGKPLSLLFPPDSAHEFHTILKNIKKGERIDQADTRRLTKSGKIIHVSLLIHPILNALGKVTGGCAIVRDITQQKLTEEALTESEARFRTMADIAPVLIWISGPHKLRAYLNKKWLHFRGRSLEEELGNGWLKGVHPDDVKQCLSIYETAFDSRQDFRIEYRLKRYDGVYRWILDTGIPRYTPQGTFLGYFGCCLDITDRRKEEEIVQMTNQELKRASVVKSEFTSMVSHELKTPLAAIKEGIDITYEEIDGPINEEQKKTLKIVRNNVDRLSRLLNNVLSFSKIESGQWEISLRKNNLSSLLSEISDLMQLAARKKGINFLSDLPPKKIEAICDADKISQVIINLIDNAIKYTNPGGQILLRLRSKENEIRIEVKDTGPGIKKEDQENIFEIFKQSSNHKKSGAGVGLAVCKKLVEQHQGYISIESEPGQGASFIITLPKDPRHFKK